MSTIKKKNNIWYFDDYFESLRKKENEIATSIRQFVLDPKRYLFNTKETLHDAVLTMKFLSPYHDRYFTFIFKDIVHIRFKTDDKNFKNNDLIIHQFSLKPKGVYEYVFIFADGQKVTIKFKRLEIIEKKEQ